MARRKVPTCVNLSPEVSARLSEVSRCMAIKGHTKSSVTEQALRLFFNLLDDDQSYQDLQRRIAQIKDTHFDFQQSAAKKPRTRP